MYALFAEDADVRGTVVGNGGVDTADVLESAGDELVTDDIDGAGDDTDDTDDADDADDASFTESPQLLPSDTSAWNLSARSSSSSSCMRSWSMRISS